MTAPLDDAALSELLKLVDRAHSRCALNVTDVTILSALPALVAEVRRLRLDVEEKRRAIDAYQGWCQGDYDVADLRSQLSAATQRAEEAERRASDEETRCSSLVSARDLTIRDLKAQLLANAESLERGMAALEKACAERAAAEKRAEEAIEFAQEGWSYANGYFKAKHKYEERLAALRAAIKSRNT